MYFLCSFCKRCCNFATFEYRLYFCFVWALFTFFNPKFSFFTYLLNLRKTTHFSMSIFRSLISKLNRVANPHTNDDLEDCEIHIDLTFILISPSNFSNSISVRYIWILPTWKNILTSYGTILTLWYRKPYWHFYLLDGIS